MCGTNLLLPVSTLDFQLESLKKISVELYETIYQTVVYSEIVADFLIVYNSATFELQFQADEEDKDYWPAAFQLVSSRNVASPDMNICNW